MANSKGSKPMTGRTRIILLIVAVAVLIGSFVFFSNGHIF
jgi:hypothetical protein